MDAVSLWLTVSLADTLSLGESFSGSCSLSGADHWVLFLCLTRLVRRFSGSFAVNYGLTATLNAPRSLSAALEYRVLLFDSLCASVPSLLVLPEVRWYNGQWVILWSQSDRARHQAEQQFVVGDWPSAETGRLFVASQWLL